MQFSLCLCFFRGRFIYSSRRRVGPLAWCIGRVVVGFEGSLWLQAIIFSGVFGMSVEVAVCFRGTCFVLTVLFPLDLDFR